jgi:hypothetical protein
MNNQLIILTKQLLLSHLNLMPHGLSILTWLKGVDVYNIKVHEALFNPVRIDIA